MNVYYDYKEKKWWHNEKKEVLFGTESLHFNQEQPNENCLTFNLVLHNHNNLPIIGILTSRSKKKSHQIGGNLTYFRTLHEFLKEHGIFSYVFSLQDARITNTQKAYIFSQRENDWLEITAPFPTIIYNRIPKRTLEYTPAYLKFKENLSKHDIILFNQAFIDKYVLYTIFSKHEKLQTYLPKTELIVSANQLYAFLKMYRSVYIKPRHGHQGKGIYRLTLHSDRSVLLSSPKFEKTFRNFTQYWAKYKNEATKQKIVQEAILPKKLKNGHRYDFRLLVHYDNAHYKVTGKGVRMSEKQEITTHIPNGGMLLPYKKVATKQLDKQLHELAQVIGIELSKELGFIGEFSIDIGECSKGNLYIYEVNSKPMAFDEAAIERKRLHQLKKLFSQLKYPVIPIKHHE